jgi:hypothetical protein
MNALKRTLRKKKKEELKNVFRESNGKSVEKQGYFRKYIPLRAGNIQSR